MSKINCNINEISFGDQVLNLVVNFQANTGVTHITGRNGVGKTTLLKAIAGIYSYQGDCSINGSNIRNLNTLS